MMRAAPLHTYWSIIAMTFVALVVVHLLEISPDRAVWVFILFMAAGVPVGELLERRARRSKSG